MTSALLLFVLVARQVGLRGRLAAQAETHTLDLGGMRRLLLAIVGVHRRRAGPHVAGRSSGCCWTTGRSTGTAAWKGLFHGIASFNNAGISIFPGGLSSFVGNGAILMTIAVAVIVGGLGFPVWLEVWRSRAGPRAGASTPGSPCWPPPCSWSRASYHHRLSSGATRPRWAPSASPTGW